MSKMGSYLGVFYILLHSSFDVVFYVFCQNSQGHKMISNIYEEVIFVFFYNLKSLVLLLIIAVFLHYKSPLKLRINWPISKIYLTLSFFSVMGFVIFLYSLKNSMIANAMSLKYTEQLYWVAIGIFVFKEKLSFNQLIGITLSFLGVILLILVEIEKSNTINTYIFPLVAAGFWAISSNIGKYIMNNVNNIIIHMIYYYFFHLIILLLIILLQMFLVQVYINPKIIFGSYEFLFQMLSMLFFYKSLKLSPISILAPFIYIKIILSVLIGYLFLENIYSFLQIVSYILFILGGLKLFYNLSDERKY